MIPSAAFGRTNHESSRVIFGAAALSRTDQETADAVLEQVRAAGINHLDTAAGYGDSELRLAPLLGAHREEFFVATKTSERGGDGARASLERSLDRLGVSAVDLIQLHNLVEEEEWSTALGPGGALDALVRARDEGLVRFIGVTGHGLRIASMHRRSLERFDFDSVLFPYNVALVRDPAYRRDVEELLELCAARGVAAQTIKSVARRRWDERPAEARSWYEPVRDEAAIGRAVRFVLSVPPLFLNSSSDFGLLGAIVAAAGGDLTRPTEEEMADDVAGLGIEPLFDGGALERI